MKEDKYDLLAHRLRASYAIILRINRQDLEKRLKKKNITISPLSVAAIRLIANEPKTIGELSKMMIMAPASLVPVVDTLVKNGFIKKDTDPKDRRRNPLTVTQKGIQTISKFKAISSKDALVKNLEKLGVNKAKKLTTLSEELLSMMTGNENMCKSICDMVKRDMTKIKGK